MSPPTTRELSDALDELRHSHAHGAGVARHEVRTRWVVALTFAMMVGELVVGYATNSLALTADGWHMATHAGALGMAALAYWFARTRAQASAFSFGTGKVHALAGYTSAVVLAMVALWMVAESVRRLVHPETIAFGDALPVAVLGLVVNLLSARLLHGGGASPRDPEREDGEHAHGGDGGEAQSHGGDGGEAQSHGDDGDAAHSHADDGHEAHSHGHDHNLRAAYLHVLADALTSVLAILALVGGRYLGWTFLDASMGLVGGVVIARWSYGLCLGAGRQLLDVVPSEELASRLRRRLEERGGTHVVDLHLWEIGPNARACIVSLATSSPEAPAVYRELMRSVARLDHVTVEVQPLATPEGRAEW